MPISLQEVFMNKKREAVLTKRLLPVLPALPVKNLLTVFILTGKAGRTGRSRFKMDIDLFVKINFGAPYFLSKTG